MGINPAITLGLLLGRKIDLPMGVYQCSACRAGSSPPSSWHPLTCQTVAIGTPTLAADVNPLLGVVLEMIATFFLVLVVYGTVVDRRAPASVYPFAIGLTTTTNSGHGAVTAEPSTPRAARLWRRGVPRLFGPLLGGGGGGRALPTAVFMPRPEPESIVESGRRDEERGGLESAAVRAATAPSMRW